MLVCACVSPSGAAKPNSAADILEMWFLLGFIAPSHRQTGEQGDSGKGNKARADPSDLGGERGKKEEDGRRWMEIEGELEEGEERGVRSRCRAIATKSSLQHQGQHDY